MKHRYLLGGVVYGIRAGKTGEAHRPDFAQHYEQDWHEYASCERACEELGEGRSNMKYLAENFEEEFEDMDDSDDE